MTTPTELKRCGAGPWCRRRATMHLDDVSHYCGDHGSQVRLYRTLKAAGVDPVEAQAVVTGSQEEAA